MFAGKVEDLRCRVGKCTHVVSKVMTSTTVEYCIWNVFSSCSIKKKLLCSLAEPSTSCEFKLPLLHYISLDFLPRVCVHSCKTIVLLACREAFSLDPSTIDVTETNQLPVAPSRFKHY